MGTAHGRKQRKKLDLRLMHNLNREATQQVRQCTSKEGRGCCLHGCIKRGLVLPRHSAVMHVPFVLTCSLFSWPIAGGGPG